MSPVLPAFRSAMAAKMPSQPELDLGAVAMRITASPRGMAASGRPSIFAASMQALTMGMIWG